MWAQYRSRRRVHLKNARIFGPGPLPFHTHRVAAGGEALPPALRIYLACPGRGKIWGGWLDGLELDGSRREQRFFGVRRLQHLITSTTYRDFELVRNQHLEKSGI